MPMCWDKSFNAAMIRAPADEAKISGFPKPNLVEAAPCP